jgi:hypothetical protein
MLESRAMAGFFGRSLAVACNPHEEFVREFAAALGGSAPARAKAWEALGGCGEDIRAVRSVTPEGELNTFDWERHAFTSRAAAPLGPLTPGAAEISTDQ